NELSNSQYATVAAGLKRFIADKEKPPVVIRADANAAHKYVVTVMNVLADMDFTSVSIATTPTKSN
ncbi:MAG TPA: biopolymer transporter ExbD, partial [Oceanospirillales bacterium]|nr:biopolymer transporter ExbD [Oceanospirillales bacterium]